MTKKQGCHRLRTFLYFYSLSGYAHEAQGPEKGSPQKGSQEEGRSEEESQEVRKKKVSSGRSGARPLARTATGLSKKTPRNQSATTLRGFFGASKKAAQKAPPQGKKRDDHQERSGKHDRKREKPLSKQDAKATSHKKNRASATSKTSNAPMKTSSVFPSGKQPESAKKIVKGRKIQITNSARGQAKATEKHTTPLKQTDAVRIPKKLAIVGKRGHKETTDRVSKKLPADSATREKSRSALEDDIPKAYDPSGIEASVYETWESADAFRPNQSARTQGRFTVLMPPPNVTGKLHLGHAIALSLEDIMVRYHRMGGDETLFLPGTDHAGIATQVVVEKRLAEESKTREGLGREKFVEKVWAWKSQYHKSITEQIRRLGVSCDWTRERFTLDEGLSRAVKRAFVELYRDDVIYQGNRIVNWCPRCATVLSDMEVVYREETGRLWTIRYFVKAADKSVVVATARPETLLGDTAVAIHPDDKRYKEFIGKFLILPIINREIPVIADASVDMEFGTGAMKVTPAHDETDFAMSQRHNLPIIQVIDKDGNMGKNTGKFAGLSVEQARENIVGYLDNIGNLEGGKDILHNVAYCQRCGTKVEPMLSKQWFVRMQSLAEETLTCMRKEKMEFVPARFETTFHQWLENVHDWCISRQLWWGHRIPAYTCKKCSAIAVAEERPEKCGKCKSKDLVQDEDVLDTWFSSALWPFSTLGWPSKTQDLKRYFPSSVLETGYDIIFFWVIRMTFMSVHFLKHLPFEAVYLHGLVRDEFGRKMSKSLGNGIDPIEIIERFGTDALRLSLVSGHTPGNDVRFSLAKVEGHRNFINKLWNAARFILIGMEKPRPYTALRADLERNAEALSPASRWILHQLTTLVVDVTAAFERHAYGEAAENLQDFTWKRFCDWYIEAAKIERTSRRKGAEVIPDVLCYVMLTVLKLLHPFTPFVTEKIWSSFKQKELLALSDWPSPSRKMLSEEGNVGMMQSVWDIIHAVRNLRTEHNLAPSDWIEVTAIVPDHHRFYEAQWELVRTLTRAKNFKVAQDRDDVTSPYSSLVGTVEVFVTRSDKELGETNPAKRKKSIVTKEAFVTKLAAQLENKKFLNKAEPAVVAAAKKRLEEEKLALKKLKSA